MSHAFVINQSLYYVAIEAMQQKYRRNICQFEFDYKLKIKDEFCIMSQKGDSYESINPKPIYVEWILLHLLFGSTLCADVPRHKWVKVLTTRRHFK